MEKMHKKDCAFWADALPAHCDCGLVTSLRHQREEEEKAYAWWLANIEPDLDPYAGSEWTGAQ